MSESVRNITRKLPKEAGFYWLTESARGLDEVVKVERGKVMFIVPDSGLPVEEFKGALWSGPIEPPGGEET